MKHAANELEVVVIRKRRNLYEWHLQNGQGEVVDIGRAASIVQARLDGLEAIKTEITPRGGAAHVRSKVQLHDITGPEFKRVYLPVD
jgi:hypothetical protein